MTSADMLEANLSALRGVLPPESCTRLRSLLPAAELEISETVSGHPTCRAFGRWVYSRHDPVAEARRLVERQIPRSAEICVFENIGLGYHVEALLDAFPHTRAVVIEPDLRWFRAAIGTRDLSRVLSSQRVSLLLDASADLLPMILAETLNVHVVKLRALEAKDAAYFERVAGQMQAMLSRREINKNTLARFGKRWVRNLMGNIDLILRARDVQELAGAFAGVPCLLLAAGPSLDLILPLLRELQRRFLLLSVDTSYRAALSAGVVPDFLAVVDPQYWNSRHLDGCPIDSTILVSESSTYPSIFHRGLGPLFFCGSLFPLGRYLEAKTGPRAKLGAGGSVATTAWDFARLLGCTPIVCAGLDLGFPESKTHFLGGFFEERLHLMSERFAPAEGAAFHLLHDAGPYPVANNAGGSTLTDKRLVVYKWWFENQMKLHPEARTLNLAPQGVKIAGLEPIEVEKLLDYPEVRGEIDRRIATLTRADARQRTPSRRTVDSALAELAGELTELRSTACTGLAAVDELERTVASGGDPGPLLTELEKLDAAIARTSSRDIAGFLMHATAQAIIERQPNGDDPAARGREAIEDSRKLYAGLSETADYHLGLLRVAQRRRRARQGPGEEPDGMNVNSG